MNLNRYRYPGCWSYGKILFIVILILNVINPVFSTGTGTGKLLLRISEDLPERIPVWLKLGIFAFISVLILSLTVSALLKQKINLKTNELQKLNIKMQIMEETLRATTTTCILDEMLDNFIKGALKLADLSSGILFLQFGTENTSKIIIRVNAADREEFPHEISFPLSGQSQNLGNLYLLSSEKIRIEKKVRDLLVNLCSTTSVAILNYLHYDQISANRQELEIAIAQRTGDLQIALEKAKAADYIKSAFLATMSHELRTPLNSIIGFTGILLQELAGPLNPEQKKQLSMVYGSSHHLLALINDVLDISKIEAGELSLSVSKFDVKASIENVLEMVRPLAQKRGLEIRYRIDTDVGVSKADQRRFEQILLNLLNNGIKFTQEGSIDLACGKKKDHYLLTVSDTGIGIREKDIPEIFKPFYQIDSGLSRHHEGTGLGLSICKKLLDLMGGSISVRSQLGTGSQFIVEFPGEGGLPV